MRAATGEQQLACPKNTLSVSIRVRPQVNSSLSLPIDEVAPGEVDSSGEPIDAKLYTTFWGLQNVFKVSAARTC